MTLVTLTDKERADLIREIALALGLDPESAEPDRIVAVARDAREARDSARFGSMKLGPG